jgi:hypothetical protein
MAHARWLTALVVPLTWLAESRGQVRIYANPYDYGSIGLSRGLGFSYHRHRLSIKGFAGSFYTGRLYGPGYYGPLPPAYGVGVNGIVIYQPPTVVINSQSREESDPYDTTGIDLDEIDPVTMKPRKQELAREKLPEGPVPAVKQPAKPMPVLPKLKDEPRPPAEIHLIEQGKKTFADKAYGLAAQHFRLAAEDKPRDATAWFLLAQAQFALGKYRDAVGSIHAGMDLKPDWPRAKFSSRQLYQANDVDFLGHLKRLEDVVDTRPDDPVLLFLLAYELWFDGKPAKARPLFEKAKRLAKDPAYCNRFLE